MLVLGTMVTAPLAAMLLGQLGAQVTKVEHPVGGDPFRKSTGGQYSPNFIAYNRNKTSIQIDLTTLDGRARLLELVAETDILIENFRPGVMPKASINLSPFSQNNILGWDPPYVIFSAFTRFDAGAKTASPTPKRPATSQPIWSPTIFGTRSS